MNPDQYKIRLATMADVGVLAHHRTQMWLAMGVLAIESAEAMIRESIIYFREAIPSFDYIGWVIYDKHNPENIVAGGGFSMKLTAPLPDPNGQTQPVGYSAHELIIKMPAKIYKPFSPTNC